ncbi:uncharacterized protein STEHIDRAFT_116466 [Stereum hirsutum FP-91666 SS1]|uniref:Uncharacterized protein n=1 Tax=Stereum hirsutum (strain FP-91666) TaxID=721885 RepID=R7RW79_STEHR|nr:uncharacterized protein STEHIDRAFT_116466 [Stereum hirsutum FP-91666 SS1]EIM79571.1 hypothetical protein STEHIDRAFT_116466 [Stereum hirsutum FP-91666 SS1]
MAYVTRDPKTSDERTQTKGNRGPLRGTSRRVGVYIRKRVDGYIRDQIVGTEQEYPATLLRRRGNEGRVVAREWRDRSLGTDDSGGKKDDEEETTHEGHVRGRRRVRVAAHRRIRPLTSNRMQHAWTIDGGDRGSKGTTQLGVVRYGENDNDGKNPLTKETYDGGDEWESRWSCNRDRREFNRIQRARTIDGG